MRSVDLRAEEGCNFLRVYGRELRSKSGKSGNLGGMTTEKHKNEVGFPIFPGMWADFADGIWRRRKKRAEAMYALVVLLARECRLRAELYGGESDWFFDTLAVKRALAEVGIDY